MPHKIRDVWEMTVMASMIGVGGTNVGMIDPAVRAENVAKLADEVVKQWQTRFGDMSRAECT